MCSFNYYFSTEDKYKHYFQYLILRIASYLAVICNNYHEKTMKKYFTNVKREKIGG